MNRYINEQIRLFLDKEDIIAALSSISACISKNYDRLNWAGFYLVRKNELVQGPFQGKPACTYIPFDKGVCCRCCRDAAVQRIDDVLAFPGHIACDSASRSKLCVPMIINGEVIGEINLDSPENAALPSMRKRKWSKQQMTSPGHLSTKDGNFSPHPFFELSENELPEYRCIQHTCGIVALTCITVIARIQIAQL